jgi:monoamine oxidase
VTADVLVIGGGFAGLTAARDLAAAGRSVVVLEARSRLGGRTWYRPFAGTDVDVEIGGAWFSLARQPPLAEEVERYGVAVGPVPKRRVERWFTDRALRRHGPVPEGEAAVLEQTLAEIAGRAGAAGIEDDVAVSAWLEELAVPRATRDFVLGWASFMSGAEPGDVSMLEVIALVAQGNGSPGSLADEIGERFEDGTAALSDAIAADSGAEVRLGAPVVKVAQEHGSVTATVADGTELEADAAVFAIPLNTLAAVELEPPLAERLASVAVEGHPGRSRKLWLLAEGVSEGLAGVGYGTPFNWLSWEANVGDASLLVGFAKSDVEDLEAAVRAYEPAARVLAVDTHDWAADPWSRGTWATSRPGWTSSGAFDGFLRPHGRVVFAGSDLAEKHPGWIAGAIASGRAAARQVLDLGRVGSGAV